MTFKNEICKPISVASAVALAIGASVAGAATLATTGALNVSTDGAATATAGVGTTGIGQPIVTLGTDFEISDRLIFTLDGATVNTVAAAPTLVCASPLTSVSYVSRSTTAVTFQVQVDAGAPTVSAAGTACTMSGLSVNANSMTSEGAVTFTFKGQRNFDNADIDVTNTATTLATKRAQFALASTTNFNGSVDHRTSKGQSFTDGLEDSLVFSFTNNHTDTLALGTDRLVLTVTAESGLSILNNSSATNCTAGSLAVNGSAGLTYAVAASSAGSCSTISVTVSDASDVVDDSITLTVGKTAGQTTRITPTSFSLASATIRNLANSQTTALTDSSAGIGSWGSNSSRITVPYMPYGAGSSRVLYVANRGGSSGAVTFELVSDTATASCTPTGASTTKTVAANAVTVISGQFDAAVRECFGSAFAGKVAAIVNVAATAQDIELFSMYNAGGAGGRVVIPNSSNGRKANGTVGVDFTE